MFLTFHSTEVLYFGNSTVTFNYTKNSKIDTVQKPNYFILLHKSRNYYKILMPDVAPSEIAVNPDIIEKSKVGRKIYRRNK